MKQDDYLNQLFKPRPFNSNLINATLSKRQHRNILLDGLKAIYVPSPNANAHHIGDIVSAQGDTSIPQEVGFYYFEMKIVKRVQTQTQQSLISIGFADSLFPQNKQVGFTQRSVGYISDGKCRKSKLQMEQKVHSYKQDDIVGCGINLMKNEVFYTLNGQTIISGIPYEFTDDLRPTVSFIGEVEIELNFGKLQFKYDVSKIFKAQKCQIQEEIQVQSESSYSLHLIVQEYLWSQGYLDTLKKFEQESSLVEQQAKQKIQQYDETYEMVYEEEIQQDSDDKLKKKIKQQSEQQLPMTPLQRKMSGLQSPNYNQLSSLERKTSEFQLDDFNQQSDGNLQVAEKAFKMNALVNEERQKILYLIREGKIMEVVEIIGDLEPNMLTRQGVLSTLYGQQFIELIKQNRIHEAIVFGQQYLINYINEEFECVNGKKQPINMKIEQILGLICYDNIEKSVLSGLISQEQRERVSDFINKSLLLEMNYEDESTLEICLKQLIQVCEEGNRRGLFASDQFQFNV